MDTALQTMINNMPEKTGKSLEEWKVILKDKGLAKHGENLNFLKKEFGVTHGFANTIVTLFKNNQDTADDLVSNQYKGKESLFPIYEQILTEVKKFGEDITITPKKGSVSLIRKKQFALVKPATKTRIDLGLKIKDKPVNNRLENSGPFGTMCTHRVKISSKNEIDTELLEWLKEAYSKSI